MGYIKGLFIMVRRRSRRRACPRDYSLARSHPLLPPPQSPPSRGQLYSTYLITCPIMLCLVSELKDSVYSL